MGYLGYSWCLTSEPALSLKPKILLPDGSLGPCQGQLGFPTLTMAQDPISALPTAVHSIWSGDGECWSSAPLGWIHPYNASLTPLSNGGSHDPAQGRSSSLDTG